MMDAGERALLAATVGSALAAAETDPDAVLAELGWLDLLAAEPDDAIAIVFDALGGTNRAAGVLDDVLATALGVTPRADLAVLLPQFGAWDPPGLDADADAAGPVVGLATARVASAREMLLVSRTGSDVRAAAVPVSAVERRAVTGIDPDAGLFRVRIDRDPRAGAPIAGGAWETAIALGRRALAQQIAGTGRAMLALARVHALERIQFGRPIASFQAVRHRLADALVAIEALDATLGAARDEANALTAALAKATAGRTANIVAAHCQQVLAGIGFTTDHPFHRFRKRAMVLDGLLGSADAIAVDVGRTLLSERRVPTLIEL